MKVVHADLYRLSAARELDEIGLDEALGEGALLVEWPELLAAGFFGRAARHRAGDGRRRPPRRDRRHGHLAGAARAHGCHPRFLDNAGWQDATRAPLAGDASYRRL